MSSEFEAARARLEAACKGVEAMLARLRVAQPPADAPAASVFGEALEAARAVEGMLIARSRELGGTDLTWDDADQLDVIVRRLFAGTWQTLLAELVAGAVRSRGAGPRARHAEATEEVRMMVETAASAPPDPLGLPRGIPRALELPPERLDQVREALADAPRLSALLEMLYENPDSWIAGDVTPIAAPAAESKTPAEADTPRPGPLATHETGEVSQPPDPGTSARPPSHPVPVHLPPGDGTHDDAPAVGTATPGTQPGERPPENRAPTAGLGAPASDPSAAAIIAPTIGGQGEPGEPGADLDANEEATSDPVTGSGSPSRRGRAAPLSGATPSRATQSTRPRAKARGPAPQAPRPAARRAADFPAHLESFQAFRACRALDERWRVREAPWLRPGWRSQLEALVAGGLSAPPANALGWAVTAARALEADGESPTVARWKDIHAAHVALAQPEAGPAVGDEARLPWLRSLVDSAADPTPAARLALGLEAIRPTAAGGVAPAELDDLLEIAGLESTTLRTAIHKLLETTAFAPTPSPMLRLVALARPVERSAEELEKERVERTTNFVTLAKRLRDTREVPRIELPHCRAAWREVCERCLDLLQPVLEAAAAAPRAPEAGEKIRVAWRTYFGKYTEIADDASVRYEERARMDNRVELLRLGAMALADTLSAIETQTRKRPPTVAEVEERERAAHLDRALAELTVASCARPEEELLRRLLVAHREACVAAREAGGADRQAREPQPVLGNLPVEVAEGFGLGDEPAADSAWMRLEARDVMAAASRNGEPGVVSPPPADEAGLRRVLDEVHANCGRLAEVGYDDAANVARLAVEQLDDEARAARPRRYEALLARAWIDGVRDWLATKLDTAGKAITARAAPAVGARVDELVRAGKLAEAYRLTTDLVAERSDRPVRFTRWRWAAVEIDQPAGSLLSRVANTPDQGARDLCRLWATFQGSWPSQNCRSLAAHLRDEVFGGSPDASDARSLAYGGRGYRLSRDTLAECLAEANPTFLAQVHTLAPVVLLVPQRRISNVGDVQEALRDAAEDRSALVVLVTPGLSPARRGTIRSEMPGVRRFAMLDDLDLARLLETARNRPTRVAALLEIALEQLPLEASLSPYGSGHGRFVKMEMFVGRDRDADDLVMSEDVVQLFSGRKLGKSALLSFIEQRYDDRFVNDRTLRVVNLDITGESNEDDLVARIIEAVSAKYEPGTAAAWDPAPSRPGRAPGDRYAEFLNRWARGCPGENLLILLDEADSFVEDQVARAAEREGTLSWKMRAGVRDRAGAARVRHIVAGYRCTNTVQGAWANWGRPKVLKPLRPTDAMLLFEGPFARLGIDVSAVAATAAWHCGYQPALVLALGQRLVEHLRRATSAAGRASGVRQVLRAEDLDPVRSGLGLAADIRQVTMNNFQGNAPGEFIFRALLRCCKSKPIDGVRPAVDRVLAELAAAEPNLAWLGADDDARRRRVREVLDEAVERKLLVAAENTDMNWLFLRFPHHLDLLTDNDGSALGNAIRLHIENLSSGVGLGAAGLVGREEIRAIVRWRDGAKNKPPQVVLAVSAGAWPQGLSDPHAGVVARLGVPVQGRLSAGRPPEVPPPFFGIDGVDGPRAAGLLEQRVSEATLGIITGGPDLLRWAVGLDESTRRRVGFLGTKRLSRATVRWWFLHRRLHDPEEGEAASQHIWKLTAGIPVLVALVDDLLSGWTEDHGAPDPEDLEAKFRDRLDSHLAGILGATAPGGLGGRELDLVQLAVEASECLVGPGAPLWEHLDEMASALGIAPPTIADEPSWAFLAESGLLPEEPSPDPTGAVFGARGTPSHRLVGLAPDDPTRLVLSSLRRQV